MGHAEEIQQITDEESTWQRLKNKNGHDFESAGAHSKVRYNRVGPITKDTSGAVVIGYVDGGKSYRRHSGVTMHFHQRLIAAMLCGRARDRDSLCTDLTPFTIPIFLFALFFCFVCWFARAALGLPLRGLLRLRRACLSEEVHMPYVTYAVGARNALMPSRRSGCLVT